MAFTSYQIDTPKSLMYISYTKDCIPIGVQEFGDVNKGTYFINLSLYKCTIRHTYQNCVICISYNMCRNSFLYTVFYFNELSHQIQVCIWQTSYYYKYTYRGMRV